jgi:hypothetical protein
MNTDQSTTFAQLLAAAVTEPGRIHEGYSAFWNYSLGNQLLALGQCHARGIAPGPIRSDERLGSNVVRGVGRRDRVRGCGCRRIQVQRMVALLAWPGTALLMPFTAMY